MGWGGERVEKRMSKFSVHWKAIFFVDSLGLGGFTFWDNLFSLYD